jgi:hypothetical protein
MAVARAPHEEQAEGIDLIEGEVVAGDDAELGSSAQRVLDPFFQGLEAGRGDEGGDDVDLVRGREGQRCWLRGSCSPPVASGGWRSFDVQRSCSSSAVSGADRQECAGIAKVSSLLAIHAVARSCRNGECTGLGGPRPCRART